MASKGRAFCKLHCTLHSAARLVTAQPARLAPLLGLCGIQLRPTRRINTWLSHKLRPLPGNRPNERSKIRADVGASGVDAGPPHCGFDGNRPDLEKSEALLWLQ